MESIQSRLVKFFLRLVRLNKMWKITGEELRKSIIKKQASGSPEPPKDLYKRFNVILDEQNGNCYYTLKPKCQTGPKHLIYLHGGGYVLEITSLHWDFIGRMAEALQCTVTVPIYPLVPEHTYKEVFEMIVPLYKRVIADIHPENIVLMGDSAGGGMSLALAQLLQEKKLPQPGNIILISPVLDMTMSNPQIREAAKYDPILAAPAIKDLGEWYGGDMGPGHYLVSPINGRIEGLGKISLFIGTHDLLLPDARKFKSMAEAKGIAVNYYEYPAMIHVWPLFFFPESKNATRQIIEIIK